MANVSIKVCVAWWVPVYINTMKFFCVLMQCEPDYDKVQKTVMRGITTKVMK
jgi:hypothetical protein